MRWVLVLAAMIAFTISLPASAQSPKLVMDEMMVPSEPGIEIYVRNKRPADMNAFRPERTLLFVHGATYPAHTSFDLKLDGLSWMEYIAARGYDVYLLDLRGYGKSTRPKEMDDKSDANAPIVRGTTAVKDISAVVDFILKRRGIPRLNLMGWSWGTTLMATYTTQNASQVERLVLYAPAWIRTTPSLSRPAGPLGAYRMVTRIRRCCARPTACSRTATSFSRPASLTTTPRRSRCRLCWCTPNGTATRRPIWRRPCFLCSSMRRASATCSYPRGRTTS